jgi:uncharacterized protein
MISYDALASLTPLPIALSWPCQQDWCTGHVHLPIASAETIEDIVIIIPGGTQTRVGAHRLLWQLATQLTAPHRAVIRFDRRGTGDSTGTPASFEYLDDDFAAAITAAKSVLPDAKRIILLGHCDGASAALLAAGRDIAVSRLILLNPWARTEEIAAAAALGYHYGSRIRSLARWQSVLRGEVNLISAAKSIFSGMRARLKPAHMSKPTFVDLMSSCWQRSTCPITVIIGSADATAQEFELVRKNWSRVAPVNVTSIANGNHSFSGAEQQKSAIDAITKALEQGE